jgi:hypothetical protein
MHNIIYYIYFKLGHKTFLSGKFGFIVYSKHVHIETKFLSISKFIKIRAFIKYRIEIGYRTSQSNIVLKFEITDVNFSKRF